MYTSVGSAPSAAEYPHVARWYEHIKSWEAEHATLPGDKEAGSKLFGAASGSTPAPAAAAPAAADDDDEIDLFGSDEVYIFSHLQHCCSFPNILRPS